MIPICWKMILLGYSQRKDRYCHSWWKIGKGISFFCNGTILKLRQDIIYKSALNGPELQKCCWHLIRPRYYHSNFFMELPDNQGHSTFNKEMWGQSCHVKLWISRSSVSRVSEKCRKLLPPPPKLNFSQTNKICQGFLIVFGPKDQNDRFSACSFFGDAFFHLKILPQEMPKKQTNHPIEVP